MGVFAVRREREENMKFGLGILAVFLSVFLTVPAIADPGSVVISKNEFNIFTKQAKTKPKGPAPVLEQDADPAEETDEFTDLSGAALANYI